VRNWMIGGERVRSGSGGRGVVMPRRAGQLGLGVSFSVPRTDITDKLTAAFFGEGFLADPSLLGTAGGTSSSPVKANGWG
jgi:hypothetical protein